ncbi:MAG: flagellar filament outer layer protein FlaA [Spirochaetia bacterium]|nr:flagellar filament outer layer protein FlaA [Spirochaetia bacterium]MDD7270188.1 flagellar filament outer layer protein FlaA [Treponema sp.]MDY4985572.1 flagellar filament outer layer protein FlaA [Treponema sp.]
MKRGLKVFVGLACLFVIGLPAFAQPSSKSVETFVMENFDSIGNQNYLYKGEGLSWDWSINTSRFVAENYPKTVTTVGIPNSLKNLRANTDTDPLVYGVQIAYNRKGDNWFEVYPSKDGNPYEIPFIGNVTQLDFWVWGANYKYYLEVMVRDANGTVHVLPAGNLLFSGWKNVVVNIPGWVQQSSHLRSGPENMSFIGFRVRSDASEYVDNFVIYFDQIKYTTNSLSYIFDGYELKDVDFGSATDDDEVGDAK